jgi:hypothetical protein
MGNLENAVAYLRSMKSDEELAKMQRIEAEEAVAALIPGPERGSKTATLEDGTKITVERGLLYKADIEGIKKTWDTDYTKTITDFPPPIKSKTNYSLDEVGYEWIKANRQDVFGIISQYVQVTPKKIAVSIKAKKE